MARKYDFPPFFTFENSATARLKNEFFEDVQWHRLLKTGTKMIKISPYFPVIDLPEILKTVKKKINYVTLDVYKSGIDQLASYNKALCLPIEHKPLSPERIILKAEKSLVLEPNNNIKLNSLYNPGLLRNEKGHYFGLFRGDKSLSVPLESLEITKHPKRKFKFVSSLYPMKLTTDGQSVIKLIKDPIKLPTILQKKYPINLGLEDPRLFKVDNEIYAFSTLGNYASASTTERSIPLLMKYSKDKKRWEVLGEIGKSNIYDRNFVLLGTTKIKNKQMLLIAHRPNSGIDVVAIPRKDLEKLAKDKKFRSNFWNKAKNITLVEPNEKYNEFRLGAGTPGIAIPNKKGEFVSMMFSMAPGKGGAYSGKFIKFKINEDGINILARSPENNLEISESFEKGNTDFYQNCTFPTSANLNPESNELIVHYGAGDKRTCVAKFNFNKLLKYIQQFNEKGELIKNPPR